MSNQKDDARSYSYETVRALMHHRDIEIAKLSAELAAFKVTHQRLAGIAYSIIQLHRSAAASMDVVSEGIRPIANNACAALAQEREVAKLLVHADPYWE